MSNSTVVENNADIRGGRQFFFMLPWDPCYRLSYYYAKMFWLRLCHVALFCTCVVILLSPCFAFVMMFVVGGLILFLVLTFGAFGQSHLQSTESAVSNANDYGPLSSVRSRGRHISHSRQLRPCFGLGRCTEIKISQRHYDNIMIHLAALWLFLVCTSTSFLSSVAAVVLLWALLAFIL